MTIYGVLKGVKLIEGCSEDGTASQLLLADLVYSLKLMLSRNLPYRVFFKKNLLLWQKGCQFFYLFQKSFSASLDNISNWFYC